MAGETGLEDVIDVEWLHLSKEVVLLQPTLVELQHSTKGAGRERRVHHSKSLPLLLTGERFFFGRRKISVKSLEVAATRAFGLVSMRVSGICLNGQVRVVDRSEPFMPGG